MKVRATSYTFNAAGKTVTSTTFGTYGLESIQLITNVTNNTIIYQFNNALKGGTLSGNILTLTFNTTAMNNGDKLMILVEDGVNSVTVANASIPVTGTFWQATQPVSLASQPLPTGAATETTLAAINTKIPSSPSQEHTTASSPTSVRLTDGASFYKATTPTDTQPISAASLPLPTGAATAAKQPALGTAGASSTDVITVQGIASGTAQPVSGTVTVAQATAANLNATVVQGTATNLKTQAENYQGGTAVGAANPLQVSLANTAANATAIKTDSSATTQPISAASLPLPAGAATSALQTTGNTSLGNVDTNTANLALSQGSTTTGQKGNLNLGAVSTSAPSYTNGQSAALSLDTAGALRVAGSFSAGATADTTATGTIGALNDAVILNTVGMATAIYEIPAGLTGTVTFEQSNNNFTTFQAVATVFLGGIAQQSSSFVNPAGFYSVITAGFARTRVRVSAYTSGSSTVLAEGSVAERIAVVLQGNPNNLQTGANLQNTNVVSTANSTTATLGSAGVFTGTSEDISNYASVTVTVFTDQASATDGLSMQQSTNGTNWDVADVYTVPITTAGNGKTFAVQATAKFFRVVYTNGGVAQTNFRLQTIFHVIAGPTSSTRPQDARTNDNDMQESLAYNMVWNGTTFDRARGSTTGLQTIGGLAHDAVDTAANFPTKVGGVARTSNPTPVSNGDVSQFMTDDKGRQVVITNHVRDLVTQNVVTLTSTTTETSLLAAGGAGVFHDLTYLKLTNSSATGTLVTIRDATAGTAVDFWYVPAGTTLGGVLQTPFKQTTANNAWTIQCGTSVASVYATVQAVKNV